MKGFALGMILIAIYVAVQDNTASRVEQAGNVFGRAVRRLMSPGVAGIPQRSVPQQNPSSSSDDGADWSQQPMRRLPQSPSWNPMVLPAKQ